MSGKVIAVTEATLKALAREWFMRGFRCSGYRAHGETRLASSEAFERLLGIEFDRAWANRRRTG